MHGIATSDGGYLWVGKCELAGVPSAYAVKLGAAGAITWAWRSAVATASAANAALQLPGGGDLLVVGYSTVGGVLSRSVTKLGLSTGTEAWTYVCLSRSPPALTPAAPLLSMQIAPSLFVS